jgi:cellulose synthase (UDP-forming)
MAWPYFAVYFILLIGCGTALYRYLFEPGVTNLMLVVGLWNFFNLLTAGVALGVAAERRTTEASPSLAIDRQGRLVFGGRALDVAIERASALGCTIRFGAEGLPPGAGSTHRMGQLSVVPIDGAPVQVPLPVEIGEITQSGDEVVVTLQFQPLDPKGYGALASLMYGDAGALLRFQQSRRRHKNILSGTLQLIWWGLVEPFRAASYAFKAGHASTEEAATKAAKAPAVLPKPEAKAPLLVQRPAPFTAPGDTPPTPPPGPSDNPLVVRQGSSRIPGSEAATDWVRLMLEFENDRLLEGAGKQANRGSSDPLVRT